MLFVTAFGVLVLADINFVDGQTPGNINAAANSTTFAWKGVDGPVKVSSRNTVTGEETVLTSRFSGRP